MLILVLISKLITCCFRNLEKKTPCTGSYNKRERKMDGIMKKVN